MRIFAILALLISCCALTSCATVRELQEGELAKTVESFRLNPVQPNCYWYDGRSYEYNQYEIRITSRPCESHISWSGKYVGDTPFLFRYSGTLDRDERVIVRATPMDGKYAPQEGVLRIRDELPRQIDFTLLEKK